MGDRERGDIAGDNVARTTQEKVDAEADERQKRAMSNSVGDAFGDSTRCTLDSSDSDDNFVDEEDSRQAWQHIMVGDGQNVDDFAWPLQTEEKTFWQQLKEEHPEAFDFATTEWWKTCKFYGRPIDFFELRELVRPLGHAAIQDFAPEKLITGEEGFRKFEEDMGTNIAVCRAVWEKLRTKNVNAEWVSKSSARKEPHNISNVTDEQGARYLACQYYDILVKAYVKVIAPYEQTYRYTPIRRDARVKQESVFSPMISPKQVAHFPLESPDAAVNLEEANEAVRVRMSNFLSNVLPKLEHNDQTETGLHKLRELRNAIEVALKDATNASEARFTRHAPPRTIAIVGQARHGKSFLLNQILAVTEVPQTSYNIRRKEGIFEIHTEPSATDAAEVAARVIARTDDVKEEDFEEYWTELLGKVQEVDYGHQPWVDPRTGDKRLYTNHERVVIKMPAGKNIAEEAVVTAKVKAGDGRYYHPTWTMNQEGKLNPDAIAFFYAKEYDPESFGQRKAKQERLDAAFANYATGPADIGNGDFLLPSNDEARSVTAYNTYITGGQQYASVVVFTSRNSLECKLREVESTGLTTTDTGEANEIEWEAMKNRKGAILHKLYALINGVSIGGKDEPRSVREYEEDRDEWVSDRIEEWNRGTRPKIPQEIHSSVRGYFNKIHIWEGAGLTSFDDRIYIKSRLDGLLNRDSRDYLLSNLVEEVHCVVPSDLLELSSNCALVDTPGLGDNDPVKSAQTEYAMNNAAAVIVFANSALSAGHTSNLEAVTDFMNLEALAIEQLNGERKKALLIAHVREKSRSDSNKQRAVPKERDNSILNKKVQDDVDELKYDALVAFKKLFNNRAQDARRSGGGPFATHESTQTMALIRSKIVEPLLGDSIFTVFPALRRALHESDFPQKEYEAYCKAARLDDLVQRLRELLQEDRVLKVEALLNIVHKLNSLEIGNEVSLKPEKNVRIPVEFQRAAHTILQAGAYKTHIFPFLKDSFSRRYKLTDDTLKEYSGDARDVWVDKTCDDLLQVLAEDMPQSWAPLRDRRRETPRAVNQRLGAIPTLLNDISDAKNGCFLAHGGSHRQGRLCEQALSSSRKCFHLTELWATWVRPAAQRVNYVWCNEVIVPAVICALERTAESLADDALEGGLRQYLHKVIPSCYSLDKKLVKLEAFFFTQAGKPKAPQNQIRRANSLYRRVLNSLFKRIFEDVDVRPQMNYKELRVLLETQFSEAMLKQHKGFLKERLMEELNKLIAGPICSKLNCVFLSKRKKSGWGLNRYQHEGGVRNCLASLSEVLQGGAIHGSATDSSSIETLVKDSVSDFEGVVDAFRQAVKGENSRLAYLRRCAKILPANRSSLSSLFSVPFSAKGSHLEQTDLREVDLRCLDTTSPDRLDLSDTEIKSSFSEFVKNKDILRPSSTARGSGQKQIAELLAETFRVKSHPDQLAQSLLYDVAKDPDRFQCTHTTEALTLLLAFGRRYLTDVEVVHNQPGAGIVIYAYKAPAHSLQQFKLTFLYHHKATTTICLLRKCRQQSPARPLGFGAPEKREYLEAEGEAEGKRKASREYRQRAQKIYRQRNNDSSSSTSLENPPIHSSAQYSGRAELSRNRLPGSPRLESNKGYSDAQHEAKARRRSGKSRKKEPSPPRAAASAEVLSNRASLQQPRRQEQMSKRRRVDEPASAAMNPPYPEAPNRPSRAARRSSTPHPSSSRPADPTQGDIFEYQD